MMMIGMVTAALSVAAFAATIPSVKAAVIVGCFGNPHDVGGGHNLHETDKCPGF